MEGRKIFCIIHTFYYCWNASSGPSCEVHPASDCSVEQPGIKPLKWATLIIMLCYNHWPGIRCNNICKHYNNFFLHPASACPYMLLGKGLEIKFYHALFSFYDFCRVRKHVEATDLGSPKLQIGCDTCVPLTWLGTVWYMWLYLWPHVCLPRQSWRDIVLLRVKEGHEPYFTVVWSLWQVHYLFLSAHMGCAIN